MDGDFARRLLDWATGVAARTSSIPALLDRFCAFLNSEGMAIRRCNLLTETVHPLMANSRHVWFDQPSDPGPINPLVVVGRSTHDFGGPMVDEVFFNVRGSTNPQYLASPFHQVDLHGEFSAAINPPGESQPFPLFDDLAAQGCTGYHADRLVSFAGLSQKLGLATDRPGGFADRLDDLRTALATLSLHLNTLVEAETKSTLARVYLGEDPGRRVCTGMIHAGDIVSIEAAIWFSDLRGFTESSHGVDPHVLIGRLNRYFAEVAASVYGNGGEILKYIGDAVLAIFPVEAADGAGACARALAALEDSGWRLRDLNEQGAKRHDPALAHGVGLHLGSVSYGNIGSADRLDFTVIGSAVNLASRIEGMCKVLGEDALASGDFAHACGGHFHPLGCHDLKGIATPVELFAVRARG